jgi:hypothetical protein
MLCGEPCHDDYPFPPISAPSGRREEDPNSLAPTLDAVHADCEGVAGCPLSRLSETRVIDRGKRHSRTHNTARGAREAPVLGGTSVWRWWVTAGWQESAAQLRLTPLSACLGHRDHYVNLCAGM